MLSASIEYYDVALYGYMAPVLVQVFFPHLDKSTAYFFYFFCEFLATLSQLLGARILGGLGDKKGRKPAMYRSMLGISLVTFFICLIPSYAHLGILATVLFVFMRCLQSFFLGGEYNGGAIYCLEHEKNKLNHGVVSGLYGAFTVMGILLASIVALLCNTLGAGYFRLAYALSFVLMLFTFKMRVSLKETPDYLKVVHEPMPAASNPPYTALSKHSALKIIVASLFFGVIYGIPTKVFNALLPIAIDISSQQIMLFNSIILLFYAGLLVLAGIVVRQYPTEKMMLQVAIISALVSYPLISFLTTGGYFFVFMVKFIFILLAAFFIGPFHAWAQGYSVVNTRYKRISTSYTLGKCASTLILSFSFMAYKAWGDIRILGLVLCLVSGLTVIFLYQRTKEARLDALSSHIN